MIKMNRTTEYGLIALRHISRRHSTDPNGVTSAREIADYYGLPFEITAKTLQRPKESGLIDSAHGARGGYTLQKPLTEVTLAEFLEVMEGPQAIVACGAPVVAEGVLEGSNCVYHGKCEIKGLMTNLNTRVLGFLSGIRLTDLIERES